LHVNNQRWSTNYDCMCSRILSNHGSFKDRQTVRRSEPRKSFEARLQQSMFERMSVKQVNVFSPLLSCSGTLRHCCRKVRSKS